MKRVLLLATMCANVIYAGTDISKIPQQFHLKSDIKYALPGSKSHKEPSIPEDEKLAYAALTVLITQLAEGRTSLDLFSETKRWLEALKDRDRNTKYKAIFKTVIQYAKQSSHLFTSPDNRIDLKRDLTLACNALAKNQDSNAQTLRKLISEILEFDTKYTDSAERAKKASEIISELLDIKDDASKIEIPSLDSWYASPTAYLKDTWEDVKEMWHNGLKGDAIKALLVSTLQLYFAYRAFIMIAAYFNIDLSPYIRYITFLCITPAGINPK